MKKLLLLLFLIFNTILMSSTVKTEEFTCPIGGEKFKQLMAMSGYQAGTRTDLMPYGAIIAPWPIPQCPENKLVMYKEKFTEKELEYLKEIIESKEYKEIPRDAPARYYLAKTYEMLNKIDKESKPVGIQTIAYSYLQSTWVSSSVREDALKKSLDYYKEIDSSDKYNKEEKLTAKMLIGELSRLLGDFENAEKVFSELKNSPEIKKNEYLKKVVNLEIKLTNEKNTDPQDI